MLIIRPAQFYDDNEYYEEWHDGTAFLQVDTEEDEED